MVVYWHLFCFGLSLLKHNFIGLLQHGITLLAVWRLGALKCESVTLLSGCDKAHQCAWCCDITTFFWTPPMISQVTNDLCRPAMTYVDLLHCRWNLCGKTGSHSATLGSSSTYMNIVIFVLEIIPKLNQIWMCWNFRQPPPLLRRPSPPTDFLIFSLKTNYYSLRHKTGHKIQVPDSFLGAEGRWA